MTEKSSVSQEKSKIHLPNKDLVGLQPSKKELIDKVSKKEISFIETLSNKARKLGIALVAITAFTTATENSFAQNIEHNQEKQTFQEYKIQKEGYEQKFKLMADTKAQLEQQHITFSKEKGEFDLPKYTIQFVEEEEIPKYPNTL